MKIRLAERVIEVHALFDGLEHLCADYVLPETDAAPDFSVDIAMADIDFERMKSEAEDAREGVPVRHYSDAYFETLAVYRKIAEQMPAYDTVLFHGSVVAVDGVGYLFTAKSGTGKSTHTRLWRERFGSRAVMINDDKPLLRITDRGVLACGTPWDGKHRLSSNCSVPLGALCALERGTENRIVPVTRQQLYPLLLQQTYRPADRAAMQKTLLLLDRLAAATPLFRLQCNMSPEAAAVAYEGMKPNTGNSEECLCD